MTPREYKLHLTKQQKLGLLLPAVMFTIFPVLIYFTFPLGPGEQPDYFPFFAWAFAAIAWYVLLTLPYRLNVQSDGTLEFVGLLRRRRVSVHDIVSIAPSGMGLVVSYIQEFRLTHKNGKFGFVNQFTGMHELLSEVRRANPHVELIGC